MKLKTISVSYGQTIKGDARYESERFDMTLTFEAEDSEETDPENADVLGKRAFKKVMRAVEEKSGRKMRRKKED